MCSYNVVTKMGKQARQCASGVLVIFDEQYTQRFGRLATGAMVQAIRWDSIW
jgi:hypothetical protein